MKTSPNPSPNEKSASQLIDEIIEEPFGSHKIAKERPHEISAHFRWHQNTSIHTALVDLLGKPIAESSALCIPTATHALGGPELAWRFISGQEPRTPMCELGWKSLGVLELTALHIDQSVP